jgi:hypothetical protein
VTRIEEGLMSELRRCILGTVFGLSASLGAGGCGGVTDDRVAAREKATGAICDRYEACGLIGSDTGDAYLSREQCVIDWRANRDDAWTAAECQGRISQSELNVCLSAIAATACMGFDFVTTLLKCTAVTVCSGGSPRDAGGN